MTHRQHYGIMEKAMTTEVTEALYCKLPASILDKVRQDAHINGRTITKTVERILKLYYGESK